MMKRCLIALMVLTAAGGVSAAEKDKDAQEPPKKEKVICKTDRATGSLTRRTRTCRTKAQWDEQAAAARKGIDDLVRDSNRGAPANDSPTPGGLGGGL